MTASTSPGWSSEDSANLYHISAWGAGYFSIADNGNILVHPDGPGGQKLDLFKLTADLCRRGHALPVLLRFSDILRHRIGVLCEVFTQACQEHAYGGAYLPVYPIKVNQQRDVIEELIEFGRNHQLGVEAGSKPELLIALAHMDNPEALIICNGYKDTGYIETALLAQKLGRYPIIVIDRFAELEAVIRASRRLGMRPHLGVRARLCSRGLGRWEASSGEGSKFGLSADELVKAMRRLRQAGMLDCLELLHFHIGSQISAIRPIKEALRESSRIYVELSGLGANLRYLDVGGGLGVDYDGSKSSEASSINYSLQEYANDIVWAIMEACDEKGVAHPDLISESGRALTAHHAVLVFDVLGSSQLPARDPAAELAEHESTPLRSLYEVWELLTEKNFLESFHDAVALKEEAFNLFKLGYLDLEGRALTETVYWAICKRVLSIARRQGAVADDLADLERHLADTYYGNFSVFQSLPDHWAIDQLFPIVPIHRLNEQPTRKAVLADLTCDSDGKVEEFIDAGEAKHSLDLHELLPGSPYLIGAFLVGAYQETLGDLHNLFGDTNAIHISLEGEDGYRIERVVEGDSIAEVLGYVQYSRQDLMNRVRRACEAGLRSGVLEMEDSAKLLKRYSEALDGYTYLLQDNGAASNRATTGHAGNAKIVSPAPNYARKFHDC